MKKLTLGTLVLALGVVGSANAAVDTTAIETAILADISTVQAYGFGILVAVLSASIGIKLVKKFTNKAT